MDGHPLGDAREDPKSMSGGQLLDCAARYNAELRRGRKLVAEGNAIIAATINQFVACQNELMSRASSRLEEETDKIESRPEPPE
jgi:hypothetical protein